MHRIASWLDAFELWVVGLSFIPQFVLMLSVVIPISFSIAWILDRTLNLLLTLVGRGSNR